MEKLEMFKSIWRLVEKVWICSNICGPTFSLQLQVDIYGSKKKIMKPPELEFLAMYQSCQF